MRLITSLALTCFAAAMAFAAEPLGTASSSTSFDLNGVVMKSDGVSSWPIVAGDEVHAGRSAVVLRFQDGSRMTLSGQGRVKLVQNGSAVSVNLTGGEAQFSLAAQSALQVLNLGRPVGARSGSITTRTPTGVSRTSGPRPDVPRVPPQPISSQ